MFSEAKVKAFVVSFLESRFAAHGITPDQVPDDLDLLGEGIIDSLGLLELVAAIDEEFGVEIDFEELDPDQLTVVGPFSDFVQAQISGARPS